MFHLLDFSRTMTSLPEAHSVKRLFRTIIRSENCSVPHSDRRLAIFLPVCIAVEYFCWDVLIGAALPFDIILTCTERGTSSSPPLSPPFFLWHRGSSSARLKISTPEITIWSDSQIYSAYSAACMDKILTIHHSSALEQIMPAGWVITPAIFICCFISINFTLVR